MNLIRLRICALVACCISAAPAWSQNVDEQKLKQLREKYEPLESIYMMDVALNNLNVHLRPDQIVKELTKRGIDTQALNTFRKFLFDLANDRALLQLELHDLRALFKRSTDPTASISVLPWSRGEVFHIAVLCDGYLQGQIRLAKLKQAIDKGTVSLADAWKVLDEVRRDPYVPVVTMTDSLKDFVAQASRSESQLVRLQATDPVLFSKINNFKASATNDRKPENLYFTGEWPSVLKGEWTKRYKLLESYGGSTTSTGAVAIWQKQLDNLQDIQFSQMVRSAGGQHQQ